MSERRRLLEATLSDSDFTNRLHRGFKYFAIGIIGMMVMGLVGTAIQKTTGSSGDMRAAYIIGATIATYEQQCGPIGPKAQIAGALINNLPVDHPLLLEAMASVVVRDYQNSGMARWCYGLKSTMEQ